MAYTVTLTGAVQAVNTAATPDTAQLILVFNNDDASTSDEAYTLLEKGVRVGDWGSLEWSYDYEEMYLVQGTASLKLFDADYYLRDILFEIDAVNILFQKNFSVEIKVNGVTEFLGECQEDSISYDEGERSLSFTADSNVAALNKTALYAADNSALNPFSYSDNTYYKVVTILEDIFQIVNPAISYPTTLEVVHDWLFEGQRFLPSEDENQIQGITFQELQLDSHQLFFDHANGPQNVGELLKWLCRDWGAYAGMIRKDRAFFKKLYTYDAGNLQTLGTVLNRVLTYPYGLVDYVSVTTPLPVADPNTVTYGVNADIAERSLAFNTVHSFTGAHSITYTWDELDNVHAIIARTPNTDDGTYHIMWVYNPEHDWLDYNAYAFVLADYQWRHKGFFKRNRIDRFVVAGVGYDYMKNFTDGGYEYQIVAMRKKLGANVTEIDAIVIVPFTEFGT